MTDTLNLPRQSATFGTRLVLLLIAVLLTGAVLAGLVYRFCAEKLKRAVRRPDNGSRLEHRQ